VAIQIRKATAADNAVRSRYIVTKKQPVKKINLPDHPAIFVTPQQRFALGHDDTFTLGHDMSWPYRGDPNQEGHGYR